MTLKLTADQGNPTPEPFIQTPNPVYLLLLNAGEARTAAMVAESGDAGGTFDSFVEPAGERLETLR